VKIDGKMVQAERFGQTVFDINDLHKKELEFEVIISQFKLRELAKEVRAPGLIRNSCMVSWKYPSITIRSSRSRPRTPRTSRTFRYHLMSV